MKYGSPTVKWISFLLLVSFLLSSQHFFTRSSKAQALLKLRPKVSADLFEFASRAPSNARIRAIVQFNGDPGSAFDLFLLDNSGNATATFQNLNARAVDVPADAVDALASRPEVSTISPDRAAQRPAVRGSRSNGPPGSGRAMTCTSVFCAPYSTCVVLKRNRIELDAACSIEVSKTCRLQRFHKGAPCC